MNTQAKLGDRVKNLETPREWGYWQRHICSAIIVPAARIRSLGVMTRTGSIPNGGQKVTQSFAVRSKSADMNSTSESRSEDEEMVMKTQA